MDSSWVLSHGLFVFGEVRYPPFDKGSSGWLGIEMNPSSSYIPMIGGESRAVPDLYPLVDYGKRVYTNKSSPAMLLRET